MRPSGYRSGILWGLGALLLLAAAAWWVPGPPRTDTNTYSVHPRGKRAFFAILEELGRDVLRGRDFFARSSSSPIGRTLCILGPTRELEPIDVKRLANWVSRGGHLVFVAAADAPPLDLEAFSIRITGGRDSPAGLEGEPRRRGATSTLVSGTIEWPDDSHIQVTDGGVLTLIEADGEALAVSARYGDGVALFCASDRLFWNETLANDPTAAVLAVRLIDHVDIWQELVFDETFNDDEPGLRSTLLGPEVRRITIQLLLCGLLFAWAGSRRFGPEKSADPPPRRSIVEHARALGHFYWRARAGHVLLARYAEYTMSRLRSRRRVSRRRAPRTSTDGDEMIRALSDLDAAKVIGARNARALKRELRDLASDVKAPPAAAGRSMRWLARLRSQLETTGPARALRRSE